MNLVLLGTQRPFVLLLEMVLEMAMNRRASW